MYLLIVLVNDEMEAGRNPEFVFENSREMVKFLDICVENGYSVEVRSFNPEKE